MNPPLRRIRNFHEVVKNGQVMDLNKIIRREVINQKAYHTENLICPVKLDANESPFPLPSVLKQKLFERLSEIPLHRYPAAGSPSLIGGIAASLGVTKDMVLVGNGSDELIALLCAATGGPGSRTLIPTPTFAMYRISAQNYGHQILGVPLDETFGLDIDAMRQQIRQNKPALTFLSYPNNPTGNCFQKEMVEEIIRESPGIVVVDEAYYHFSGRTFIPMLLKYDNLVILRSFSKVGLAAMRIGLLVGGASLVQELNKVRLPYNLNAFSQAAAEFFIDYEADFIKQTREIIRLREALLKELQTINIIQIYPTDANFVFFRCTMDADHVYRSLVEQGIMVRNFNSPGILNNCLRVTVGSPDENNILVQALRGIAAEFKKPAELGA